MKEGDLVLWESALKILPGRQLPSPPRIGIVIEVHEGYTGGGGHNLLLRGNKQRTEFQSVDVFFVTGVERVLRSACSVLERKKIQENNE